MTNWAKVDFQATLMQCSWATLVIVVPQLFPEAFQREDQYAQLEGMALAEVYGCV